MVSCLLLQALVAAPATAEGVDGLQRAPVAAVTQDALGQKGDQNAQTALFLPFDAQTGIAAFWSGPDFIVVADQPVPAMMRASGGTGVFSGLTVTVLDHATLLRIPLPQHPVLRLSRQKEGWQLQAPEPASLQKKDGQTALAPSGAAGAAAAPGSAAASTSASTPAPAPAPATTSTSATTTTAAATSASAGSSSPSSSSTATLSSVGAALAGKPSSGGGGVSASLHTITAQPAPGYVLFPLQQPGHEFELPDPATGARLLIATSRTASGGVAQAQHAVGYSVRPTLEGVVVEADADQIVMQGTAKGAVLRAVSLHPVPVGLPLPEQVTEASRQKDWQWFGLQEASPATLAAEREGKLAALAKASARQKKAATFAAAQAAFASGAFQKAATLLADMPETTPDSGSASAGAPSTQRPEIALRAASALLAGNLKGARALVAPEWISLPEFHLWQGLYGLYAGQNSQRTAILLAAGFAQAQHYPAPLRDRIAPAMALYIARYGTPATVRMMEPLPDGPAYDLPRALLQAREGKTETARVALENLTASDDAQRAAIARTEIVRLMQDADLIAPDMAADVYRKLLKGENGASPAPADIRTLTAVGLAHALIRNGEPKVALSVLEGLQPSADVPEDVLAEAYRAALYRLVFNGASASLGLPPGSEEELSVTQRTALVAQGLPHVPDGAEKAKLLLGYGRLLLEAGHADTAATAFSQAIAMQADPQARAEGEELLAQAAMQAHQLALAQMALDHAVSPLMPDDLAARKAYDAARVAQARGETEKAQALLAHDESDAGLDLRGQLYEADHRWADAVLVVGRLASRGLPQDGALTEAQRALAFRLATDAAAARDWETLHRLKDWLAGRTLGRERDALFTLLLRQMPRSAASH
ncbi:hypothetical protein [Acetobacter senegalensis]|uniref:hypothetical protein n=1 Tax=Acetobacter senegalensis TaxID=446692 RepID=UPI000B343622|nr:hypothetical protein [Acetobacter senegalensis]